jgi:hypothetical protein
MQHAFGSSLGVSEIPVVRPRSARIAKRKGVFAAAAGLADHLPLKHGG